MREIQGALIAAKTRRPKRKNAEYLEKLKGFRRRKELCAKPRKENPRPTRDGGSRRAGNLIRRTTDDMGAPLPPVATSGNSGRYYRGSDLDTRDGGRISPLRAGRRTSLGGAWHSASDAPGAGDPRPRIFAAFINKNTTGGYAGAPTTDDGGA